MAKLSTVLDQVDTGMMLLPEFQRGYVWNRDQVRGLMRSIYRDYPVGALLIWETETTPEHARGSAALAGGPKQLLLDGQQRVTTLYGVIRGRAPGFFEGDRSTFTGLYFHVESETFEFYTPAKMRDDPRWIDVTRLFTPTGMEDALARLGTPENAARTPTYLRRLSRLENVTNREFHVETITGEDKTVDVVVDIFNRVNSGGTKLSKGDLALARICADWPEARPTMRRQREAWAQRGFDFSFDWLLRCVNAVANGTAPFSALEEVDAAAFERALSSTAGHVEHLLQYLCVERLGLDHDRVLLGRYAFPVLARLLERRGGRFADAPEAARAMAWYLHAALRGRFAGSTETMLTKDLATADREGVDGLLRSLGRWRGGRLDVEPADFEANGRGSRFYPLLYLLTRVLGSRDLRTGAPFTASTGTLHVQEIFPKAALHKAGYSRAEVNAIANFAFVTPDTGQALAKALPADYLPGCAGLEAQWVPTDPALWTVERYRDFLAERRRLLTDAANGFLAGLAAGTFPAGPDVERFDPPEPVDRDAKDEQVAALVTEFRARGYAEPAIDCEIPDPETGRVLAVAEAFWVDGLQIGQGKPVVLELDPDQADLARLAELGCEVFTRVDALRAFAARRDEVAAGERTDDGPTVHDVGTVAVPLPSPAPEPEPASGDLDRAVVDLLARCEAELRYNPRYFRGMVAQHGALGAVRHLLAAPAVSDGFVKLWEQDRLDLTVEALVLDARFADLVTEHERTTARRRLDDFGYAASA